LIRGYKQKVTLATNKINTRIEIHVKDYRGAEDIVDTAYSLIEDGNNWWGPDLFMTKHCLETTAYSEFYTVSIVRDCIIKRVTPTI
jgi:hypothetical protein